MDVVAKVNGSYHTALEVNQVVDELENVITSSGITLSASAVNQAARAAGHYSGGWSHCTVSNLDYNNIQLAMSGVFLAPSVLFDGLMVRFKVLGANTGVVTLKLANLASKPLRWRNATTGIPMSVDEFQSGYYIFASYVASQDCFFIEHVSNGIPYYDNRVDALGNARLGEIIMWHQSTPPAYALELNGATILRATFPGLVPFIGTTIGAGDGLTTMVLPDWRGLFPRFWADGSNVYDPDFSRAVRSVQAHAMSDHTHFISLFNTGQVAIVPFGNGYYLGPGTFMGGPTTGVRERGLVAIETRPTNVALMPCIIALSPFDI